jgi:hypothetical protein
VSPPTTDRQSNQNFKDDDHLHFVILNIAQPCLPSGRFVKNLFARGWCPHQPLIAKETKTSK